MMVINLDYLALVWLGWYAHSLWTDAFKPQNPVPITTPAATHRYSGRTDDDDESSIVETRDTSPAHFLTKINSFSLLSHYGIDKYETREFVAGNCKWKLIIYPDGKKNDGKKKSNHISVDLAMTETSYLSDDSEFNVTFTIFLYNQISGKYGCFRVNARCFNKTTSTWGFSKLISKKMLIDQSSGYLVDDNIVLGAEVLVISRHRVIETVNLLAPTQTPKKCEWKIQEVSKFEEDRVWISDEFTVRDVNWKMKLFSPANSDPKGRELSMELVCASADTFDAHQKVKAEFYMRLDGKTVVRTSGKFSHWFTSSDKSCEHRAFVSFAMLRDPKYGFLVDDCCTLQLEISVQLVVK